MNVNWPDYLDIPANKLGRDTNVVVEVVPGMEGVARHMAQAMLDTSANLNYS